MAQFSRIFSLLFKCIGCRQSLEGVSFPLCESCQGSLVDCPLLCPRCGSPRCLGQAQEQEGRCIRPWITPLIRSFGARYWLIGRSYSILRKWKTSHGPMFDRQILNPDSGTRRYWNSTGAMAVIPIPQRIQRTWILGGSPAEKVATWISGETGIPRVRALEIAPRPLSKLRQAELSLPERLALSPRFIGLPPSWAGEARALVVDDFMTSGRTLQAAAKALLKQGWSEVHAFCLGARPQLQREARESTTKTKPELP